MSDFLLTQSKEDLIELIGMYKDAIASTHEHSIFLEARIKNIEQDAEVKTLRRLEKKIQQLRAENKALESFRDYVYDQRDDHALLSYECFTEHHEKCGYDFWLENPNSESFHDDPDHLPDRQW